MKVEKVKVTELKAMGLKDAEGWRLRTRLG